MSIRGGFDRLTKEIDALTYNSRSVLNALIRSTVASGSSNGYTVTRAGVDLTLSRVDIYRLYTFYQAWAANDFVTVEGQTTSSGRILLTFDQIRLKQDETPVVDDGNTTYAATTDSLVIHSQILFLNSTTLSESNSSVVNGQIVDNISATDYWLNLLKDYNDPKLLSNSAPIPINLRTPVFDENMATSKYNNHPTYLFPYQYFGLQLLGYKGDDTDHFGGGKSWTWDIDERFNIKTPAYSTGGVSSSSVYKTDEKRNYELGSSGGPVEQTFSTVWGYDTHARALYSTAGGRSSMVPRNANNSTAIGLRNLASALQSTAIGGTTNQASAQNSGIFGGKFNVTAGNLSFATNSDNITGGLTVEFTLPLTDSSNECVVDTDGCEEKAETGSQFGANQIALSGNFVSSGLGSLNGFSIGDDIVIYAYTTFVSNEGSNEYYSTNGDTFIAVNTKITSVEYDNNEESLNFGKTIITMRNDLPNPSRIDGGKVTRTSATFGQNNTRINLGNASSVFGTGNYASGISQTVLGSYSRAVVVDTTTNVDNTNNFRLSRLVVGSGAGDTSRENTLEVYDGRMVVHGNGRTINDIPVTAQDYVGSEYIGFDVNNYNIKLVYDGTRVEVNSAGFRMQKNTGTDESIFIETATPSSGNPDQLRIQNNYKSIRIQTGDNTDLASGAGSVEDGDVFIISRNDAEISALDDARIVANTNIEMRAGQDFSARWGGNLILTGETLGALPTTDKQFSHTNTSSNIDLDSFINTGFYFINGQSYTGNVPSGIGEGFGDGFHLMTMGSGPDVNNGNTAMQLAWAGPTNGSGQSPKNYGRPAVRASDSVGNGFYEWNNLAYLDDISGWKSDGNEFIDDIVMVDGNNQSLSMNNGWGIIPIINYMILPDMVFFNIHLRDIRTGWVDSGNERTLEIRFNNDAPWGRYKYNVRDMKFFDVFNVPNIIIPTAQESSRFSASALSGGTRTIQIDGYNVYGDVAEWDNGANTLGAVSVPEALTFHMYSAHDGGQ